jgi:hypothetical protein
VVPGHDEHIEWRVVENRFLIAQPSVDNFDVALIESRILKLNELCQIGNLISH